MSIRRRSVLVVFVGLALPSIVLACLWDSDTLQQERSRFPSTLELITGKFLRHSPEFYEWRIQDRLRKLQSDPNNLSYHDDLGVAYDKIGENQKAIDIMLAKDRIKPDLYETEANLGTFLIHGGKLEEGLKHIEKALKLNPNAHFGREKYQKAIVEFLISRRKEGKTSFPLEKTLHGSNEDLKPNESVRTRILGFRVGDEDGRLERTAKGEEAVKGILGIMRFANHNSPMLLELLGHSLTNEARDNRDAKQLAARAFLKASYEIKDETAKKAYRTLASSALHMQLRDPAGQTELKLAELEDQFQGELKEASAWYDELREKEISWIREGKDPEVEFNRLYAEEPEIGGSLQDSDGHNHSRLYLLIGISTAIVLLMVSWFCWRGVYARRLNGNPTISE